MYKGKLMEPARKTVSVTRSDIWHGIRGDSNGCPISRALKRQFPGQVISVFQDHAVMSRIGRMYAVMPEIAAKFIASFDKGGNILRHFKRPFTFSIEFVTPKTVIDAPDFIEDKYYNSELV